jgi:hypothetical protein
MRGIIAITILTTLVVMFALTSKTFAAGDTLEVYSSVSSLDQIINSDTTSGGLQAHKAYKLVSLDTTYIFLGAVTVKSDFTVIGALGSDGRPPCIQPGVLSDGSLPEYLFVIKGADTKAIIKNLYITGLATNNTIKTSSDGVGALIEVAADNTNLYVDNVIFEDWPDNAISYSGNWDSFFITNCKFRNMISPTGWYSGEGLRNHYNSAITDSIVMKYNTFFCINAYAACPVTSQYTKYFEFDHNSILYNFQNPFWIFNVTEGKVNNNLFYANWTGGITKSEYTVMWDQLWSLEVGSLIDLDTLDIAKAKYFVPEDSADANIRWIAEAKRNIEVKNNVYFWPKAVTDFWTEWQNAGHADSLITPLWMNNRTQNMFTDKTHWPNLVESGNQSIDPGFGASIDQVLYNNVGNGVGIFQYFTGIRTNTATTDIYGYQLQSLSGDNWIPQWPLPELTDMQYSNASLSTFGTDGKYVGDPGWFSNGYTGVEKTGSQVVDKFALSEAYPNPFNPSTTINYNLPSSGSITLKVYNVMGELVKTLVNNEYMNAGSYKITVNFSSMASGVYFYTLVQGNQQLTKKLVLMK